MEHIRLIASDLDGTLFPINSTALPAETKALVARLIARGVDFCAASGRCYLNMRDLFHGVQGPITYISANGSAVYRDGEPLWLCAFSAGDMAILRRFIAGFQPDWLPVFAGSGAEQVFLRLEEGGPAYDRDCFAPITDGPCVYHECFDRLPAGTLTKLSVYMPGPDKSRRLAGLGEEAARFSVAMSGGNYIDLMPQGVDKGAALGRLMTRQGLRPEEVLVFGDSENDAEMLALTPNSYAMEGSAPPALAAARHTCADVREVLHPLAEA